MTTEARRKATRKYYLANREAIRLHQKKYYDATKASLRYYEEHRELSLIQQKQYYVTHKDERRNYNQQYYEDNQEYLLEYHHTRRAAYADATGTFTWMDFYEKCAIQEWKCTYCKQEKKLEPDHIIPISRGGTNNLENITPACRECNSQKRAKTLEEYRAYLQQHAQQILF